MNCFKCGEEMKVIPPNAKAGDEVKNKAGKKYKAFWKCDSCGQTQNATKETFEVRDLRRTLDESADTEIIELLTEIRDEIRRLQK